MSMPGPPKTRAEEPSTTSTSASSSGARQESTDPAADVSRRSHSGEAEWRSDVTLHVYQCDQWTGWLNKWWLKDSEMPIYHLGVEVYGEEWSFLYFEDCWDDESISGVIRCHPKHNADFEYQESINLGRTSLSEDEVDDILLRLHEEYPACSYHLTRRNCLTFAEELSRLLKPPKPFPAELKGIIDSCTQAPRLDATVDYGWSWAKWYMLRKHSQPASGAKQSDGYLCCAASGSERQASMWALLLQPSHTCGGKMCPVPAGQRGGKIEGVDDDGLQGQVPKREGTDLQGDILPSHLP